MFVWGQGARPRWWVQRHSKGEGGLFRLIGSIWSMGLKWTDIRVHVSKETTPREPTVLYIITITPHTFSALYIIACIYSSLQVKNKPQDYWVCQCAFFLGTISPDMSLYCLQTICITTSGTSSFRQGIHWIVDHLKYSSKKAEYWNVLKGLSSEIGLAESGIIGTISFKGRGAEICNWFQPSPLMWEAFEMSAPPHTRFIM